LSSSLFTNLQTQFREENNKKATIERLEVEDGIWTQQQEHSLTQTRRDADANKVERLAYMAEQLRMKAQKYIMGCLERTEECAQGPQSPRKQQNIKQVTFGSF